MLFYSLSLRLWASSSQLDLPPNHLNTLKFNQPFYLLIHSFKYFIKPTMLSGSKMGEMACCYADKKDPVKREELIMKQTE